MERFSQKNHFWGCAGAQNIAVSHRCFGWGEMFQESSKKWMSDVSDRHREICSSHGPGWRVGHSDTESKRRRTKPGSAHSPGSGDVDAWPTRKGRLADENVQNWRQENSLLKLKQMGLQWPAEGMICWLVVWNMKFIFHILGMSSSQLTSSYFSEG